MPCLSTHPSHFHFLAASSPAYSKQPHDLHVYVHYLPPFHGDECYADFFLEACGPFCQHAGQSCKHIAKAFAQHNNRLKDWTVSRSSEMYLTEYLMEHYSVPRTYIYVTVQNKWASLGPFFFPFSFVRCQSDPLACRAAPTTIHRRLLSLSVLVGSTEHGGKSDLSEIGTSPPLESLLHVLLCITERFMSSSPATDHSSYKVLGS